jgi:hypothetical protein
MLWHEHEIITEDKEMNGMLRWFEFDHLPPALQGVSGEVYGLACSLEALVPDGRGKGGGDEEAVGSEGLLCASCY